MLRYAPAAYDTWREQRLLKQANVLLQKNDLEGASRVAENMLARRPNSLAAFFILAETSEKQNLAQTVTWRSQIARALPGNLEAQLNLASAALRFGQLDLARHTLDAVPPRDREKAAYHVVAGWLARAQGDDKGVEAHFAAALREEPTNELYQFNLAVLRLRSLEPPVYEEARGTLERLSKLPQFRAGSLRALLSDAVQREDLPRADSLAQDLQMTQQVTFSDYLLSLDFYRKLDEKKFSAVLEKIKPVATRNGGDLASLMNWMIQNGLANEVLKWAEKLPPEIATVPPPAIAIAEAFAEVKNWSRLKRWTRSGTWGDSEFLRVAYQAYATRQSKQSGSEAEFNSLWQTAERSAAISPEREAALARLAVRWNLSVEAEQLWQRVAKNAPMRREALEALSRIYRASNDLPRLLEIAKQLHESSPREAPLTANYARLALLIAPNTQQAQRAAKEAYDAAPQDVSCAVTYAFALYGLGRTAEGLEILRTLPHDALLDSHAAVYAVALLLDDDKRVLADEYIAAARGGPLFPEEKKLLDEAISRAASPSPIPSPSP
ncbi:MAG: tetratricopeptide repeat protein [Chthoniobacterales bacterium]